MTGGDRGLAASAAITTMAFLVKGGVAVPFTAAEAEATEALAAAAASWREDGDTRAHALEAAAARREDGAAPVRAPASARSAVSRHLPCTEHHHHAIKHQHVTQQLVRVKPPVDLERWMAFDEMRKKPGGCVAAHLLYDLRRRPWQVREEEQSCSVLLFLPPTTCSTQRLRGGKLTSTKKR
jgi:hypothetical protein